MNDFYVYLHHGADDNEVFYVGKGRGKRAINSSAGRTSSWHEAVAARRGFKVSYAAKGLNEFQAAILEVQTIAHHLELGASLVNRKLLVRKRNVIDKAIDGNYVLRSVLMPLQICCTFSEIVERYGCSPLELQDLLTGKIAVTNDGWIIGDMK